MKRVINVENLSPKRLKLISLNENLQANNVDNEIRLSNYEELDMNEEPDALAALSLPSTTFKEVDKRSEKLCKVQNEAIPLSVKKVKDHDKLGFDNKLEISVVKMLYERGLWEDIPEQHFLHKIFEDNFAVLFETILKVPTGVEHPEIKLDMLHRSAAITHICKKLIKQWNKCNIKQILEKKCPINNSEAKVSSKDMHIYETNFLKEALLSAPLYEKTNIDEILVDSEFDSQKSSTLSSGSFSKALDWKQVYGFLFSVIHHVIPFELFGSTHNFKSFFKTVKTLLTMGRYDALSLGRVMFEVKISHCKWVKSFESFAMKSKIVAKVWIWLLNNFIIMIIKSFFYVTETNHRKYQLFFFRKRNYQSLHDCALRKLLASKALVKLTRSEALKVIKTRSSNSLRKRKSARLRFIPRMEGMRPILPVKNAGLSKSEIMYARHLVNYIIRSKGSTIKNVGSSSQLQNALVAYHASCKHEPKKAIYMVKVDVSDAFGSIKHDLLLQILKDIQHTLPETVIIGSFTPLKPTNNTSKRFSMKYLRIDKHNHCLEACKDFKQPLIRVGYPIKINVKKAFENIAEVVTSQIIKAGNQRFMVKKGIPQGCSLSSALCDLYYSTMCDKYLLKFQRQSSRALLRCVDDFLYITPSKEEAQEFLSCMESGIEEFNCYINPNKTKHNIDGKPSRILFRGIFFCTASKQVLVSVSSLSDFPPRYALRLNKIPEPGFFIISKVNQIIKARFSPLVYDLRYISIKGLVSNIWRTGMMVGGRLVSLIATLLTRQQVNSRFLVKGILEAGQQLWSRVNFLSKRLERGLPFSRNFGVLVFIGGIYIMFGHPKHPSFNLLKTCFKRKVINYLKRLKSNEQNYLPKVTKKLLH